MNQHNDPHPLYKQPGGFQASINKILSFQDTISTYFVHLFLIPFDKETLKPILNYYKYYYYVSFFHGNYIKDRMLQ